ncbi:glycosyltransferase family 2 protein [Pantoea coffeiphila]|uniref:Glycosyl transferase n=1 Tax=Pantoea coffeiphila TaxID=1465635 RepID=A0A2S9IGB2_9GAMM|nr:glycosyl transferase [Pantoea coffeiphila]PRD16798.1 glycosyl transferase [Pantoea coffeiphila]
MHRFLRFNSKEDFKIKIAIVVVLYNKEINESATIRTLVEKGLNNVYLTIHNNGPKNIAAPTEFLELLSLRCIVVNVENCIENKPLSNLYNDFIESHADFDKFILLDDDSEITQSFMDSIEKDDYDLEIPKIVSRVDNQVYYPISNGHVITDDCFLDVQGTSSIGSGLLFTKRLVNVFSKHNLKLFDENYALYGVDVSLFRRMWNLNRKGEVFKLKTSSSILHSLSRAEGQESAFRSNERLIDYAITARRYPTPRLYASFLKRGLKQLVGMRFREFFQMCGYFISGVHPRSKMWDK